MNAADLLAEVHSRGGRLLLNGDRLSWEAPADLPADLLDRLRAQQEAADRAERLRRCEYFDNLRDPRENSAAEKNDAAPLTNYGKGYRHPDGRIETGQPDPMPRPVMGWPADLGRLLSRVATAFEWTPEDRRDFVAWARRSPEALADARQLLAHEAAKLPAPRVFITAPAGSRHSPGECHG